MEIAYRWLQDFIEIGDLEPEVIADLLTNTGLEVESIDFYESIPGGLKGVVVGKVLECYPHPDADKLKVCKVDVGSSIQNIVCGAPNVAEGQKVAVALPGTTLYDKEGRSFSIVERSIRGILSQGMICSEAELHLSENHEGIMVLETEASPGTPLSEVINVYSDWVFHIGITPNRTDALSHYGVARELSAVLKRPLKSLEELIPQLEASELEMPISIKVESVQGCPRYDGIVIYDVSPISSPSWIQNRLKSIGQRPINLLVDLTNYVLHALGQPLHAFDLASIKEGIRVYELDKETRFVTLDGEERVLKPGDLVIGDAKEPLVIAGIIGGANSGVTETTKAIFLESAYFNPVFIRRTARRLGLHTETSFRFERGTDPLLPPYGIFYYIHLLKKIYPGPLKYTQWDDQNYHPLEPKRVSCYLPKLDRIVGHSLPREEFVETLQRLDIQLVERKSDDTLIFEVPFYRHDVFRDVDVLEEFLRIYGYNQIPEATQTILPFNIKPLETDPFFTFLSNVRRYLMGKGFYEVITNSMVPKKYQSKDCILIQNPLSEQLAVLRTNFVSSHIEVALNHFNRQERRVKFFEIGKVYHKCEDGFQELWALALTLGSYPEKDWLKKEVRVTYYDLYEAISSFLATLGVPYKVQPVQDHPYLLYGLNLTYNSSRVGEFGHLNPEILLEYDVSVPLFHGMLLLENVYAYYKSHPSTYKPLPEYPSVERDLSFFVEKGKVLYATIQRVIESAEIPILESYHLFDVYDQGDQVSLAIRFRFRAPDKTLKDEEVNQWMEKLMAQLSSIDGVKLRIETF